MSNRNRTALPTIIAEKNTEMTIPITRAVSLIRFASRCQSVTDNSPPALFAFLFSFPYSSSWDQLESLNRLGVIPLPNVKRPASLEFALLFLKVAITVKVNPRYHGYGNIRINP